MSLFSLFDELAAERTAYNPLLKEKGCWLNPYDQTQNPTPRVKLLDCLAASWQLFRLVLASPNRLIELTTSLKIAERNIWEMSKHIERLTNDYLDAKKEIRSISHRAESLQVDMMEVQDIANNMYALK